MTNTELIGVLMGLIREYALYFMPVIGLLAGVNFIFSWVWSLLFRQTVGGVR